MRAGGVHWGWDSKLDTWLGVMRRGGDGKVQGGDRRCIREQRGNAIAAKTENSHAAGKNKGGLVMDSRAGLTTGGDGGAALIPGQPEKSLFLRNIRSSDPETMMPPKGERLSPAEIQLLTEWVRTGAAWPASRTAAPAPISSRP